MSRLAAIAIVGGALGLTAILAARNAPAPPHTAIRRWYRRLDKPAYTPPDPVFGGAWGAIESGLAIGGYRLLRQPAGPRRNVAVGLWLLNIGMIGGWTELFFRKRALGPSVTASGAMIATGAGYAIAARKVDGAAAATALPYLAWLGFATLLAERIWQKNPQARQQIIAAD